MIAFWTALFILALCIAATVWPEMTLFAMMMIALLLTLWPERKP